MSLNFTKKNVLNIMEELKVTSEQSVYAYGVERGFSFFPKQRFVLFDGKELTICQLSTFHKIKEVNKINLNQVSNLKVYGRTTLEFKLNGKKRAFEFSKRLSNISDSQKKFIDTIMKLKNEK